MGLTELKDAYYRFTRLMLGEKEEASIDLDNLVTELTTLPDSAEFFAETRPQDAREQIVVLCIGKLGRLRTKVIQQFATLMDELDECVKSIENKETIEKTRRFLETISEILTGKKPYSQFEQAVLKVNELTKKDEDSKQTEVIMDFLKTQRQTIMVLAGMIIVLKSKIELITSIVTQLITKH